MKVRNSLFGSREFFGKMLIIALPIMLQNFLSSFLNMIDTVMVGKLGETEIAAVGIANQYFFFFNMFMFGMCAGCGVFISQFWGKKDMVNIKRILGIGLGSAIIVSVVFMLMGYIMPNKIIAAFNHEAAVVDLGVRYLKVVLASYIFTGITFVYSFSLRSIGNTVQPMLISIIALVTNAFFNYVFIFGKFGAPAMGVEGAALATLIARVLETAVLMVSVYSSKGVLAASIKELKDVTFGFVKKSYKTIFPVILNDVCWGLASLVYSGVFGRMGTQAFAAIQICNTVSNLFMVAIFGISSAASVMVGNSIGAGDEQLGRDYAKSFCVLSILAGIALGLVLAVTSPYILNIFNVSIEVRNYAQIILYTISVIFFIRVLDIIIIVGIMRGGGDAKRAFIIEGSTMWFVGVPLTILGAFVFNLPVHIVYGLSIMEEIVKCVLGIMRLKSGRWIKNVTHEIVVAEV